MQTHELHHGDGETIHLPKPTAAPMLLAAGLTLMLTSLVTNEAIGVLGLVMSFGGAWGWFREVLPVDNVIHVPVEAVEIEVTTSRVRQKQKPTGEMHRKVLPVESFQFSAGLQGGIAGGLAMIVPATLYSLVKYHSIWYAMNLLAAGGFVSWAGASNQFLSAFHWQGFLAAIAIHGTVSVLVGLLYGALLPMYPRYPIVTAGIVTPLIMTGILHFVAGVVSPILDARIDWLWFVISQIFFGLVCGFVVNLHTRVRTPQFRALPFAVRAGIHSDRPHDGKPNDPSERDREESAADHKDKVI